MCSPDTRRKSRVHVKTPAAFQNMVTAVLRETKKKIVVSRGLYMYNVCMYICMYLQNVFLEIMEHLLCKTISYVSCLYNSLFFCFTCCTKSVLCPNLSVVQL